MRVLLIEDDSMIGESLSRGLRQNGMSVDWVQTGPDGEAAMTNDQYAVVFLDLGLPGKSGLEVLRARRQAGDSTPVIIITARDAVEDRIQGLDLGADDYVIKPFELRELTARMRAVQRRRSGAAQSILTAGEISLDLATHELCYRGEREILPAREFALMSALMERPGAILSRRQLEDRLYGWDEEVQSNAVDVLIHSIRRKFDKDIILNVRGAGWMIPKGAR